MQICLKENLIFYFWKRAVLIGDLRETASQIEIPQPQLLSDLEEEDDDDGMEIHVKRRLGNLRRIENCSGTDMHTQSRGDKICDHIKQREREVRQAQLSTLNQDRTTMPFKVWMIVKHNIQLLDSPTSASEIKQSHHHHQILLTGISSI